MTNPPKHKSDVNGLNFDFLVECANMIGSLSISMREGAWRCSRTATEVPMRQIRETLVAAIQTFKEIGTAPGDGAQP